MKKVLVILLTVIIFIIPQLGCNTKTNNEGIAKTSFHLDTVCTITVYSMEGVEELSSEEQRKEAIEVITEAFGLCDDYEKILSKTIEGSDIYRINHGRGAAVEVSDTAIEVIREGMEYGRLSEGAFDITIGPVSDLWDFHDPEEDTTSGKLPDSSQLAEAVSHVDYGKIEIEGNKVRLSDPRAQLDLGGIAKGYIADRVTEFLEEKGVTSAVVDLGGNIVVIGEKGSSMTDSQGRDFVIGVADPNSQSRELLGTIPCRDKTVVTSGTYERYFEVDGTRYHHILNPDTGYPFDTEIMSVTIISQKGRSADCDGLSTACLALGVEKGRSLIESIDGVEAIFVDTQGNITVTDEEMDFKASM